MADAPAPASASPPSPASSAAVPRKLPSKLILPPLPASRRWDPRKTAAAGSGGRGWRRKDVTPASSSASGVNAADRLAEAVRVVGRGVDPGVAGAGILELAMSKRPMFKWLTYWPEQGYPKENHPY